MHHSTLGLREIKKRRRDEALHLQATSDSDVRSCGSGGFKRGSRKRCLSMAAAVHQHGTTNGPSRVIPGFAFEKSGAFLKPFCGHLLPKVDKTFEN